MDYIGSKSSLNKWLFSVINRERIEAGLPADCAFLDGCCGSGAVSRHAASNGMKVIANDLLLFPSVIANGSIGLTPQQEADAFGHIWKMSELAPRRGFFFRNYSEASGRLYFSDQNAQVIDAIRDYIEEVEDPKIKDYLLYCSLEAISRVSNTTGIQSAYLKSLKSRARKPIVVRRESVTPGKVVSFSSDLLTLLKNAEFRKAYQEDILYIDPPYNHRQYGPNYHLYETFVRNDNPSLSGKTGLRDWQPARSRFCSKASCLESLKNIVMATRARLVFVSYSSDGLVDEKDFREAMGSQLISFDWHTYPRYKSDSDTSRDHRSDDLHEYLYAIRPLH